MDRGTWQATVHWVTKSRTWLKGLSTQSSQWNPVNVFINRFSTQIKADLNKYVFPEGEPHPWVLQSWIQIPALFSVGFGEDVADIRDTHPKTITVHFCSWASSELKPTVWLQEGHPFCERLGDPPPFSLNSSLLSPLDLRKSFLPSLLCLCSVKQRVESLSRPQG